MKPQQKAAAVIELLHSIISSSTRIHHADKIVNGYLRSRRYIGSNDRKWITGQIWEMVRQKYRLEWWLNGYEKQNEPSDAKKLAVIYWTINKKDVESESLSSELPLVEYLKKKNAELNHPDMPENIKYECPNWIFPRFKKSFGDFSNEIRAFQTSAQCDIRVNTLKTDRNKATQELEKLNLPHILTPYSPFGIRLLSRNQIEQIQMYKDGMIEIQDEGSQLITLLTEAKRGQYVIDLCAGGGGKTLGLSALMENKERLVACDISKDKLSNCTKRLERAGIKNFRTYLLDAYGIEWLKRQNSLVDVVLVDAPCSGTGTIRRYPDCFWHLLPQQIDELILLQRKLLTDAAKLIKPGGRLVYSTCSFLEEENEEMANWFLDKHSEFQLLPVAEIFERIQSRYKEMNIPSDCQRFLKLTPFKHKTDGFFGSVFVKKKQ